MTYQSLRDLISGETFLEFDSEGRPASQRLRIAVTLLLWEMAHVDGHRSPAEYVEIIRSLDHEFHLSDEESGELVQIADLLRRQSTELNNCIEEICQSYDSEQRQHLSDMLWKVAKADGHEDRYEKNFSEFLRKKLGLS